MSLSFDSDFRNKLTKISFINHKVSPHLTDKKALKSFILALFEREKVTLNSLTYIFCSDQFLKGINKKFLQHNYYTDILTFVLSEKNEPIISDIYVSIPRVRENANDFASTYSQELHRVIIHGALHLCGYSDQTEKEKRRMRKKENEYLNLLGST